MGFKKKFQGFFCLQHTCLEGWKLMVEQTDTCWLTVLEEQGLYQAVHILENYAIDSETDVSLIDQDDFSQLKSSTKMSALLREYIMHVQHILSSPENMY
jgi:hypothetical protein